MKHGAFLLNESHKQDLINHFLSLNDEERYYRFGRIMRDEQIIHQIGQMKWENSTYGIYSWNNLVGVAHLIRETKVKAEFAISINSEYQGKGYGLKLLALCVELAQARGVETIEIQYLSDNQKMAALASKLPGKLVREGVDTHKIVPIDEGIYQNFLDVRNVFSFADVALG